MKIQFKIITPEKVVYEDTIDEMTIDTRSGQITVLPNHVPLLSVVAPGELIVRKDGESIPMVVLGGFLEVKENNIVTVLADSAQHVDDIDMEAAEAAKKRAEELAKQKVSMDAQEYARVAAMLEKELARIRVARRHRNRAQ